MTDSIVISWTINAAHKTLETFSDLDRADMGFSRSSFVRTLIAEAKRELDTKEIKKANASV